MKIKKLLAVAFLATFGCSSVLYASSLPKVTVQNSQMAANPVKDTILLIDSVGYLNNPGEGVTGGAFFPVDITYGNEVFIEAEIFNDTKGTAEVELSVYINNNYYNTYSLDKNNSYISIPITLNESSKIEVREEVKSGGKNVMFISKAYQRIDNWNQIANEVVENKENRPTVYIEDSIVQINKTGETTFTVNPAYGKEVDIRVDLFSKTKINLDVYINDAFYGTFKLDKNNDLIAIPTIALEETSQIKIVEKVQGGKEATVRYMVSQR